MASGSRISDTVLQKGLAMERLLNIATGKSRFTKTWSNREVSWTALSNKLSKTVVTNETTLEYSKMNHSDQDRIKDVGGFVGGYLTDGLRRNGNVKFRSLLTLDLDFAEKNFWEDFTTLNDWACLIYSTHKCTADKPRLRLVAPLGRNVSEDEYGAISRKIAFMIGIDQFDDTTYQATRLMYYPSTSADAEFIYQIQEGEWLDPDKILAMYPDWHDVSSWPVSSRLQGAIPQSTKRKAEDPWIKEGIIGAFCRTYSITDVIEKFLSDVYTPATDGRYTYIKGSTSGGLVIYEDKWAYSNHATDPASMKLCNAWDLVRIHKFGEKDLEADADTPANRLPSEEAMKNFALDDPETRKQLTKEHMHKAAEEFKDIKFDDKHDAWISQLTRDKHGIRCTTENFLLIMNNDQNLVNLGRYNKFNYRTEIFGKVPWSDEEYLRSWTDTDDAGIRYYIEKIYELTGKDKCMDAINLYHDNHAYHPVRDYLESLSWDGVKRLDTLLVDYLGAEDSPYTRAVTRKTLTAAIKRIYEPGCKFDYMLTLIGRQGLGKSTLLHKLGQKWFSDTLTTVSGKDAYEALQGVWIMEMSELTATRKADVEATKQFISKQSDTYRMAYGRRTVKYDRQCIFVGTTNDREFLKDQTGNRRYWPVDVGIREPQLSVFDDFNHEEVGQVLAEAVQAYKNGEKVYLDAELESKALEAQDEHTETNVKRGMIEEYLDRLLPNNWNKMTIAERQGYIRGDEFMDPGLSGTVQRNRVCAAEILCECLGMRQKDIKNTDAREINAIMDHLPGWERYPKLMKFGVEYGPQRGYKRCQN